MATPKYTKIDERFGVIEYPVTLTGVEPASPSKSGIL